MSGARPEVTERLLRHQAAFVEAISAPITSASSVILCGGPGTGKTIAVAALAARVLVDRPHSRVLLLGAASLIAYWVDVLLRYGAPARRVDRYRFREMLDASAQGEVWPTGTAFALSADFAKQTDVRESLANTRWTLVVADEAAHFTGLRAELLSRIKPMADRLVVTTTSLIGLPTLSRLEDATTIVQWRRDDLLDVDGTPLAPPRPLFREVVYGETSAEESVFVGVDFLCSRLEETASKGQINTKVLFRALHSSPAALESALRRYLVQSDDEVLDVLDDQEENADFEATASIIAGATVDGPEQDAQEHVGFLLTELEALRIDSKLDTLKALLKDMAPNENRSRRICVLTEFVSTLHYLAAAFGESELPFQILHGGLREDARHEALSVMGNAGGILLATRAIMTEGVSLPNVADLVFYDLPANTLSFQSVLGRFDRVGRKDALTVHVLVPAKPVYDELIKSLHFLRMGLQETEDAFKLP